MFPILQLEVMERFTAVKEHFRAARRLKGTSSLTAKGLAFVEIYAVYEYTVKGVMRSAINVIASHAHTYSSLRPSLLTVFLDPELQSLRNVAARNVWDSRLKLLDRSASSQPITAVATLPVDGNHFRHPQVELILQVLGVKRTLTLRRRHLYVIDDVVNKRNLVSHGEETAKDVGSRYSRQDIGKIILIMEKVCLRLIEIVSQHCSDPSKHCR